MKLLHLVLASALAANFALAHQVIAKKVENHYELGFWVHDGFDKYDKKQVMGAKAYDINGKQVKSGIDYGKEIPQILTDGKVALMTSVFDALYWTKTDSGYTNKPVSEIDGIAFDTLRSIKIGKTYFEYSPALSTPLGLELEVTPLVDPLKLKVGDTLPVLVTYRNAPLADAEFETKTEELDVRTNKYGIAFIPIKYDGLQIIAAVHSYPYIFDNQAQTMTIQSSISFEVK